MKSRRMRAVTMMVATNNHETRVLCILNSAKGNSEGKVKAVIFAFLLPVLGHPKDQHTHTKEMIMCPRNFVQ